MTVDSKLHVNDESNDDVQQRTQAGARLMENKLEWKRAKNSALFGIVLTTANAMPPGGSQTNGKNVRKEAGKEFCIVRHSF